MRVLWFSNILLSDHEMSGSGTWIQGLADALLKFTPNIELGNVTQSDVVHLNTSIYRNIPQWILPFNNKFTFVIEKDLEHSIKRIIDKFQPDLIHIWGTEAYWGVIPFSRIAPGIPVLIDMQGIVSSVVDSFYGSLSLKELIKCIHIKELLRPSSILYFNRRLYEKIAQREKLIIENAKYISVQSKWVEACVKSITNKPLFYTRIALRKEIYMSKKWNFDNCKKLTIFSTASTGSPLKGIYTLLQAFVIVQNYIPDSKLRIAGRIQSGIKKSGFARFIESYIKQHKLENKIVFLGNLGTGEIIKEYQEANIFVNPSFIESYSLVIAEAMYVGTPVVATYAGAMGELGPEGEILYFPKGDYKMCAAQIIKLLSDGSLANRMSNNSINVALNRHNLQEISNVQFKIYQNMNL